VGGPVQLGGDVVTLVEALGPLARVRVPIGPLTTYRVGGEAAVFVELSGEEDLDRLVAAVRPSAVPVLVLGKGSNLLVADGGFPGICVRLGEGYSQVEIDGAAVTAGGACAYPVLARRSAAAGLTGLEWAVGIPGSVGGGVRMNAGGHGAETSHRLVAARVVELGTGDDSWRPTAALDLSYRHSAVRPGDLVLGARYLLEPGDAEASSARIADIVRWRRQNQPGGQNAGSVFTNPAGDSAGRIIEQAGLKGYRIGTAMVSEKHANFIQADPGGSADDVLRVVEAVRQLVQDRLAIELAVELRLVGWGR
jgi:UDP-N-acetylmuramate dehydrogenase